MNRSLRMHTLIGLLCCLIAAALVAQTTMAAHWVTAWSAAPDQSGPALESQTIRQVIRTSIRGAAVRIRLSNLFGAAPVTIGPVHVARHVDASAIKLGTSQALTFGGKATVTIAQRSDVLSDPLEFPVSALEGLAVSIHLPTGAASSTLHGTGIQTAFIARAGDHTAATNFAPDETSRNRFFLTDVEVAADAGARSIVIVGDSITDGVGSTRDRNARWPDVLAVRLQADPALAAIAVVNSGISGNRILNDAAEPFVGPSVLSRFERDALGKPGVRWILLLAGINDISASGMLSSSQDQVSVQQIIGGLKSLIDRAHAKGIKIWGGTLLPLNGIEGSFHSPAGEEKRQELNTWIRTSAAFDAVIDFDLVMRDPAQPDRPLPAYDRGDHLHPNDAGYRTMAAAIDLRLFTQD